MAFVIFPALRHLAQILILFFFPSIKAFTDWILGSNLLFDIPVTLCPTPPLLFAIPRRAIVLPATGFFPHIEHSLDMLYPFRYKLDIFNSFFYN